MGLPSLPVSMISIYSFDSGYIRAGTWVCPYSRGDILKFRGDACYL